MNPHFFSKVDDCILHAYYRVSVSDIQHESPNCHRCSASTIFIVTSLDSYSDARSIHYFHDIPAVWRNNPLGGAFNLAVKIEQSHGFKCLISYTSKLKASSVTYYIWYRDYKLLICSIKILFCTRSLRPSPVYTTYFWLLIHIDVRCGWYRTVATR